MTLMSLPDHTGEMLSAQLQETAPGAAEKPQKI
jgi:hypothetical protein